MACVNLCLCPEGRNTLFDRHVCSRYPFNTWPNFCYTKRIFVAQIHACRKPSQCLPEEKKKSVFKWLRILYKCTEEQFNPTYILYSLLHEVGVGDYWVLSNVAIHYHILGQHRAEILGFSTEISG